MAKNPVKDFIKPYRITDGQAFRLKDIDLADTAGLGSELKQESHDLLQSGIAQLSELQEKLYAQGQWALLLIFQAMDAAGKDSTIKHVMSGTNPQGCHVVSFRSRRRPIRSYITTTSGAV
jgi:polyphosphate kinase 2 (PPK2 family)